MSAHNDRNSLARTVLLVLGVLVLFPVVMMTFAMSMMGTMGGMGMGEMGMMGGMSGPMGGFTPVVGFGAMVVWLVALLGVGYVVYRRVASGTDDEQGDSALAELREAYAQGDLGDEEFERRVEKLLATE